MPKRSIFVHMWVLTDSLFRNNEISIGNHSWTMMPAALCRALSNPKRWVALRGFFISSVDTPSAGALLLLLLPVSCDLAKMISVNDLLDHLTSRGWKVITT